MMSTGALILHTFSEEATEVEFIAIIQAMRI
jgi:hypothetical protein